MEHPSHFLNPPETQTYHHVESQKKLIASGPCSHPMFFCERVLCYMYRVSVMYIFLIFRSLLTSAPSFNCDSSGPNLGLAIGLAFGLCMYYPHLGRTVFRIPTFGLF